MTTKITPKQLTKESCFFIRKIYFPYLGKCEGSTFTTEDGEPIGEQVIHTHCTVIKCNRKDEEGARYDIGEHFTHVPGFTPIKIDLHNGVISGTYKKTWIGGKVEKIDFKYEIESISGKRDDITEKYDVIINCKEVS
jgi:hypothetical protein